MKKRIAFLIVCVLVMGAAVLYLCLSENSEKTEDALQGGQNTVAQIPEEETEPEPPTVEEQLQEKISEMSLEEKVGQMFLVRCPDLGALEMVETCQPGGLVLFGQDFKEKTAEQVIETNEAYQEASRLPLLISVDEEGGTVCRISLYPQYRSSRFQGPQDLYGDGGLERIKADTIEKCQLLTSLGINVNLAPVCDVSANPDDYIYQRTFGKDAEATAEYVSCVVSTMCEEKVGSVLKHFPGYGNNVDTHVGFSHDTRDYETFTESEFLPFKAGIEAGAGAVLVSHNIVECMDSVSPASLSMVVHRILRDDLDFSGVILTDDLFMDAIVDYYGIEEAAVLAVQAGNDMLCCTDYEKQIPAVIEAVQNGEISEMQIDQSVLRVLLWKYDLGLIELE